MEKFSLIQIPTPFYQVLFIFIAMNLKQQYTIIVACGINNEIGAKGDLLWHLPKDMKWFKQHTTHQDVIMGRKTYESFPEKYRPLPNRTNIVITKNENFKAPEEVLIADSLEKAFEIAENCTETKKFIIGGGNIYQQTLPYCSEIILTKVHAHFPQADTFFPKIDQNEWKEVWSEHHTRDDKHQYDFSFVRLAKR